MKESGEKSLGGGGHHQLPKQTLTEIAGQVQLLGAGSPFANDDRVIRLDVDAKVFIGLGEGVKATLVLLNALDPLGANAVSEKSDRNEMTLHDIEMKIMFSLCTDLRRSSRSWAFK